MRVALVTCRTPPEPDPDQEPLLAALRRSGVEAEMLAWDDPDARPEAFDLCVLRSCWNYHLRPEEFLAWIERTAAATRLANSATVVRWNLHKRYLTELEASGLPIVPTAFVARGTRVSFAETLRREGWGEAVIKPCVSGGSYRTRRFELRDGLEAQEFLDELVRERDAMIQRYMPSVERKGEKALVWIAGRWTHSVEKAPRFQGGEEHVSEAIVPGQAELDIAARVLASLPERWLADLLYARLDLIASDGRAPLVSELELIEPSLFLLQHPPALERFVEAIALKA
jgi:hypothetical protein